jgi:hypothetical protein
VLPREVFKYSNNKYIFDCDRCKNEWEAKLSAITAGKWCPNCKHKTELILSNTLNNYNYVATKQPRFEWCKNNETSMRLPFDFLIEDYKLIIELDGRQHFEQIKNWQSPEEQQKRDLYKMECANANGYTVIRLLQEDVWFNRNNWLENLILRINTYEIPDRIFISSGNEYDVYMQD